MYSKKTTIMIQPAARPPVLPTVCVCPCVHSIDHYTGIRSSGAPCRRKNKAVPSYVHTLSRRLPSAATAAREKNTSVHSPLSGLGGLN